MKTRSFALAAIAAMLFNVAGLAIADTNRVNNAKPAAARLISLLPASDAVAVFDSGRFLNEALPTLLSANQSMLAEITSKISEMERKTGIDFRKFDQVVVGVAMKAAKEKKDVDFEPVAIASGDINVGALISLAKLGSKGQYREEKIGEKSVYIFTPKPPVKKTQTAKTRSTKVTQAVTKVKAIASEIAVTALDGNTLAIGTPVRVRETIEGASHVGADLTDILSAKETAVMSFAAKTPGGMSKLVSLDNDELGATIDSIQYLSGSLDVAAAGTSLQLMARTAKPEQALALKDTLEALQIVGKAFLGGSKRADQQVYSRMVKNAKFDLKGNDVTLDLTVPQADIDILIAKIK